jgi:hypothetical protein
MTSAQPPDSLKPPGNPRLMDTWADAAGTVHSWDGAKWVIPKPGETSIDDVDEAYTWDGTGWAPFEDFQGISRRPVIRDP